MQWKNGAILSTVDYDAFGGISRAPVPANTTSDGPVITGAVSRITHGGSGTFDVTLPLSGAPGIETRSKSGNYTLVVTFDRPVLAGTATIASGVGVAGATPTFSGNTATVSLSAVADRQTITVELDNVVGVSGLTEKVLVAMSVLTGDANQDGAVTADDIALVQTNAGRPITTSNFTCDANGNGSINSTDTTITQIDYGQGASLYPDFAFTGHYYHSRSGFYLAPYRAYNPSIGRWLSRDPIGENGGSNLYRYVSNNPLNLQDLLGLIEVVAGSNNLADAKGSKDHLTVLNPSIVWFNTPQELASLLRQRVNDAGGEKITRLDIIGHNVANRITLGDAPEHNIYNGGMAIGKLDHQVLRRALDRIRRLLGDGAQVNLYQCEAAAGNRGKANLEFLSSQLGNVPVSGTPGLVSPMQALRREPLPVVVRATDP